MVFDDISKHFDYINEFSCNIEGNNQNLHLIIDKIPFENLSLDTLYRDIKKNIHHFNINKVTIENMTLNELSLNGNLKDMIGEVIIINNLKVKTLTITSYNGSFSDFLKILSNFEVNELILNSFEMNDSSTFKFPEILKIEKIFLNNFNFNKNYIFDSINNIEIFRCKNTRLVKLNFSNCEKLKIKSTIFDNDLILESKSLKNISLNEVQFKKNLSISNMTLTSIQIDYTYFNPDYTADFTGTKIKDIHKTDISTLRKIKVQLENMGNKIDANRFHSYEMKARKLQLQKNKSEKYNFGDKFVFYTNDLVSEHGLKWYLPIYWMVFLGLTFSTLIFATNTKYVISNILTFSVSMIFIYFASNNVNKYNKEIKFIIFLLSLIVAFSFYILLFKMNFVPLIKFMNIIDFQPITDKELGNIIKISDYGKFFSKIIMGYLLYHLITSLRKDTRK